MVGDDVDEDGDGVVAKYPHLVRETLGGTLHGRALITMLIMSSTGVYPKHCIHWAAYTAYTAAYTEVHCCNTWGARP